MLGNKLELTEFEEENFYNFSLWKDDGKYREEEEEAAKGRKDCSKFIAIERFIVRRIKYVRKLALHPPTLSTGIQTMGEEY